mgnify:CR=1 FL=1
MGEARGTITQEELEKYGRANIILMNTGDALVSGGTTGGAGIWRWSLTWNNEGFIGQGWVFDQVDHEQSIIDGTFNKDLFGPSLASYGLLISMGCSTFSIISQE